MDLILMRAVRKGHWPDISDFSGFTEELDSMNQRIYHLTRSVLAGPGSDRWWLRVRGNGRMP